MRYLILLITAILLCACGNKNSKQSTQIADTQILDAQIDTIQESDDIGYSEYPSTDNDLELYNYNEFREGSSTSSSLVDMDFDGEEELLISHYRRLEDGGNKYYVYKIKDTTVQLMNYPPFNNLEGLATYNYTKKTIALSTKKYSNPHCLTRVVYRLISDTLPVIKVYPKTMNDKGRRILENYYNAPTRPFRLDSLYEWNDGILYVYANTNGKITLTEKRQVEQEELYGQSYSIAYFLL